MEKARQILKWNQRSEIAKTGFVIAIIMGATLGGFGAFSLAMGTSSPLVVVESTSMIPILNVGDLLVLKAYAPQDISVGNIVVYTASWHDKPIVHQVIAIQIVDGEYHYFTKGYNNTMQDPGYRLYQDIVGVVIFVIPLVGYVTLFLHTTAGFATVIIVLIALIVIPEVFCKSEGEKSENVTSEESPGSQNESASDE
jgi:signal peptidase